LAGDRWVDLVVVLVAEQLQLVLGPKMWLWGERRQEELEERSAILSQERLGKKRMISIFEPAG